MTTTIELTIELTTVNCGCCGGTYAINTTYRDKCYQDGKSWTCPYCAVGWGWSGKGENQKLKEKLVEKEAEIVAARARMAAALTRVGVAEEIKAKLEKTVARAKKRTAAGVCPCCPRSFVNLQRHIATKHPDYVA